MLLIRCPWCGARAQVEFSYGGDAAQRRPPDPASVPLDRWLKHLYLRDNPRGPHRELWQHAAGCRRWFAVLRDTRSHEILETAPVDAAPAGGRR